MYAVVRTDLTAGKAASQAGHAFLDAFLKSTEKNRQDYLAEHGGTKVVLGVDNERQLRRAHDEALAAGLPASIIQEEDGTVTAVGIGPALRSAIRPITRRLRLLQ